MGMLDALLNDSLTTLNWYAGGGFDLLSAARSMGADWAFPIIVADRRTTSHLSIRVYRRRKWERRVEMRGANDGSGHHLIIDVHSSRSDLHSSNLNPIADRTEPQQPASTGRPQKIQNNNT